ncbi:sensor histidine kinase [Streptomyces sp. ISL-98]|uniref:ATP-binding protein n=1 Tax=Streptomyces sp. ISL-98 TaxID=2819192 RepID=UPI001BE70947|nr:ATP-binding protein [Streptomyces sp. ISL-98]MBT2510517.1 sensor histidine kinase [Streptomyces sp. ISL-98]
MTQHIPEAVVWCLGAGVPAGLVLLVRQRRLTAALRRRLAASEAGLRARDEEAQHLVEARLSALSDAHHQAVPVPGLLDERLAGTAYGQSLQQVQDLFTQAVDTARARADQSARATLKAAMRALQALANEQQLSISDMQDRHDSPDVLQDLLEIDHANAQFGRRAQAIAVLCGSWPGRQRVASPLIDVVRGATSRIRDYRRVTIHSRVDMDVVSRAVEPVVLAVAELLDNAARHSQPNTTVEVSVQPAHNGISVVIDDAGVGMDARETEEAGRRLSGREDIDINRLGDPPQFGFATVGVLAARYGFTVSVDTRSPYGGVRAVLFLPHALLNRAHAAGSGTAPAPTPAPASVSVPAAAPEAGLTSDAPQARPSPAEPGPAAPPSPEQARSPMTATSATAPASTVGGLPKRRRRSAQDDATGHQAPATPHGAGSSPVRPASETASRMGAFARGTRSGRAASQDDEGNPQE